MNRDRNLLSYREIHLFQYPMRMEGFQSVSLSYTERVCQEISFKKMGYFGELEEGFCTTDKARVRDGRGSRRAFPATGANAKPGQPDLPVWEGGFGKRGED